MSLSKIIWASLYGSITVIVLLIGEWMRDVNFHQDQIDQRMTNVESHYSAIDQNILDMRQDLHDLKEDIESPHGHN